MKTLLTFNKDGYHFPYVKLSIGYNYLHIEYFNETLPLVKKSVDLERYTNSEINSLIISLKNDLIKFNKKEIQKAESRFKGFEEKNKERRISDKLRKENLKLKKELKLLTDSVEDDLVF